VVRSGPARSLGKNKKVKNNNEAAETSRVNTEDEVFQGSLIAAAESSPDRGRLRSKTANDRGKGGTREVPSPIARGVASETVKKTEGLGRLLERKGRGP